ncbi:MAG: hypothetical protein IJT25_02380 [Clostridia bacterium]|nr:hypothetical protein [Clostridia bacterium]
MKYLIFAVIPTICLISVVGVLIYYAIKKKKFSKLRKEKRIERELSLGRISGIEAERKLERISPKKANKNKPLTTKQKRRRFTLEAILMVLVIMVGAIGGFFAGSLYVSSKYKVTYNFSEADYRDNTETVLSLTSGKNPSMVGGVNAFITAEYNLSQKSQYRVTSNGGIQPSIGSYQTIYAYREYSEGKTYLENLSNGMMPIAELLLYKDGATVESYMGKLKSSTEADFPNSPNSTFSYEDFTLKNGVKVDTPVAYVVSSRTILVESDAGVFVEPNVYEYTLVLSPETSVMNYVKQMMRTSGFADPPKFASVQITFRVDSNFNFISYTINESYTVVYFGVPAHCVGSLTLTFDYSSYEWKH